MKTSTIIVGGGLAGLAAAAALADRGISVTLLESRPRLGGRASSFLDKDTNTPIDNCQHVSMGCCTNFSHFCRTVGISKFFRCEDELYFIAPQIILDESPHDSTSQTARNGRAIDRFRATWLPAPFHLAPALSRLSYLNKSDRKSIANGLRKLVRVVEGDTETRTFREWLKDHQQSSAAIDRFWHTVLVSALSESLDRISVWHARKVFVDAFLRNRHGWEVSIPTVPLDELYGNHLTKWLEQRGATIRLQSGVDQLVVDGERAVAVELRDGSRLDADQFIVAVPHHQLLSIMPKLIREDPILARIDQLESAPIASVHLWFDREITDLPHAALIERLSQWMFNRSLIQSTSKTESSDNSRFYYQIVISAARDLNSMSSDMIIQQVVGELARIWPAAAEAQLCSARVVTEHRAVFSVAPGADQLRPGQQSPIGNIQFAGDWTQTGWPATMEGAVRSGYLAAENVLSNLGRSAKLLQPDLPTSLLSKLLFGL